MPKSLIGTTDDNVYTHYSCLSTVETNWDLDTLGRWDVGANVFKYIADITGDVINPPEVAIGKFALNKSYAGAFAKTNLAMMPVPNTKIVVNGRKVFRDVVTQWGDVSTTSTVEIFA
jgi:acid phosphatase